jgi:hypothetical protein
MNKTVMGGLAALLVVTVVLLFAVLGGGESGAGAGEESGGGAAVGAGGAGGPGGANAGAGDTPKVKRGEDLAGNDDPDKQPSAKLPTALPKLDPSAGGKIPEGTVVAAKPHGEVEIEGSVDEGDAEAAIRAVFRPIRSCYVGLRERAPQAKGRLYMQFRVKQGDDGGSMGELFLKETQFTEPKFLKCVRKAIDETKVPLSGKTTDGKITVPIYLTPEDVDNAKAGK